MGKAMKFAENNWGDELIMDDWVSIIEFYIQDPTDLVNDRYHCDYPRTKAVIRVTLNRDLNVISNDHSKPMSELLDEAISQMTLDHFVWQELKGGRGSFTMYNCANCGAGLLLTSCPGCGHQFKDDQLRSGWHTPLSRKMVAFLQQNNHEFKINPEIALEREQASWEKTWHQG